MVRIDLCWNCSWLNGRIDSHVVEIEKPAGLDIGESHSMRSVFESTSGVYYQSAATRFREPTWDLSIKGVVRAIVGLSWLSIETVCQSYSFNTAHLTE
jgi:hypothetical protein